MIKAKSYLCIVLCSYAFYLVFVAAIAEHLNLPVNEEARLFEDLFVNTRYDNSVRPVKNKTRAVQVYLDVALVQIIDLDDADQSMQTNVWIRLKWMNEILSWNPAEYDNITSLVVNKQYPWKPDIVLYNNAENGEHRGNIGEFLTRIEVSHSGLNTWYIPAILKSSCGTDMTFFPFDAQICTMKFGSWTYFKHQVNITNIRSTMDLKPYLNSSSWYLKKTKVTRNEIFYPCCKDPIVDITYELYLEREAGFYFYNVVVPTLVITSIAFTNFMLPDLIGERVGLMFDCFLANTFTAMMIKDMLPVSSDTIPIINKFMLMCMALLLLSLFSSSFSMRCRTNTAMPFIIHKIFIDILGPLLFVTDWSCAAKHCKDQQSNEDETERHDELGPPSSVCWQETNFSGVESETYEMHCYTEDSLSQSSGYPETSESSFHGDSSYDYGYKRHVVGSTKPKVSFYDQPFSSGFSSMESEPKPTKHQINCLKNLQFLVDEENKQIDDEYSKDFWNFVSKIVDRLFLAGFVLSWISMALALFLKIPSYPSTGMR